MNNNGIITNPDKVREAIKELIAYNNGVAKWVSTPDVYFVKSFNSDGKPEYRVHKGNMAVFGDDICIDRDGDLLISFDGRLVGYYKL